jgi:Xaa-Pro aminopeptidase
MKRGFAVLILTIPFWTAASPGEPTAADPPALRSLRAQAEWINARQRERQETILPALMRRAGIDLWIVLNREYNEDPVYFSLVPEPALYSSGTVALLFHDKGADAGVERLCSAPHGVPGGYRNIWSPRDKPQFENLADFIRKAGPRRIGIDVSDKWPLADGLSASLRARLERALGPDLAGRLVSAEDLCVGWLETRSPAERAAYGEICAVAHGIIREFFSAAVITPGTTTTADVEWWARQRTAALGLSNWFQPSIDIIRSKPEAARFGRDDVIRPGDLLHCDFGLHCLGLATDMQWQAYVLRPGEADAPAGLKRALANANRAADIIMAEFKTGRTGKAIAAAAMERAKAEGLGLLVYTHAIGFHGHGAGCTIDARDPARIDEVNVPKWDYPLFTDTAYSIEFSCRTPVPEWDGQEVGIGYEEDAFFTEAEGCRFIDGRQTDLILIGPPGTPGSRQPS